MIPHKVSNKTDYEVRPTRFLTNTIALYASDGITYISRNEIQKGADTVDKYKVMMSKMSAEHAGEPNKQGMFNVFTKSLRVLYPNEVCTHSYFLIGVYDNKKEADNTYKYLKTKFVRFLVLMSLSAVNLSKLVFSFVPLLDFNEEWSDALLYEKYGITTEEIGFIESLVRDLDW